MAAKNSSREAVVSNSSMGMSWGGMEKREEGILLRASSESVESVNISQSHTASLWGRVSHDPSGPEIP
jgi:hypothetical protein